MKFKNTLSRLKKYASNKITNIKTKARNGAQKFKKNFNETQKKPISKRKCLFLGFTSVLGIFGLTLFFPILPAVAKEISKNGTKSGDIPPVTDTTLVPSHPIVHGSPGVVATISALTVKTVASGSFILGAICGFIVVVILLEPNKNKMNITFFCFY